MRGTELLLENEDFMCMKVHFPNSLCEDIECLLPFLCGKAKLQMHNVLHLQILVLEGKTRIRKKDGCVCYCLV